MTNIEIRRKILEMVYERFKEHPYHRTTPNEFEDELNIDLKELYYNMIYLEEKGVIELQKPLEGSLFVGARITYKGIDIVEDEYRFNIMFPVKESETSMQIHVFKEFQLLIDRVNIDNKLSDNLKEIIVEEIKEIQEELKRINPSYSRIRELIGKLKLREFETYKKVLAIIQNPVITNILVESARKELEDT